MILVWGVVIWAIIALMKMVSDGQSHSCGGAKEDEVLQVLRARYAKGEMAKEQFEQMRKDLEM